MEMRRITETTENRYLIVVKTSRKMFESSESSSDISIFGTLPQRKTAANPAISNLWYRKNRRGYTKKITKSGATARMSKLCP